MSWLRKILDSVAWKEPTGTWRALTEAAAPARYYGDGGTIHDNGSIDIEVDKNGTVREVWFRCQQIPFTVHSFEKLRGEDGTSSPPPKTRLVGVVLADEDQQ